MNRNINKIEKKIITKPPIYTTPKLVSIDVGKRDGGGHTGFWVGWHKSSNDRSCTEHVTTISDNYFVL